MKTCWSVLVISLAACLLPVTAQAQTSAKLRVVATSSIIADWVKNIAGDAVELTVLVGPDSDVHTFEPTPADNIELSKASLVFENGLGFEHWMDKLYRSSQSKAKRVVLTKGVVQQPLTIYQVQQHRDEFDPHAWHNVRYAIGMVKKMAQALIEADQVHADIYAKNLALYEKSLQELDEWVMKATSQIPKAQRKLVTNHDSLGYFCERYQFTLIGAAFESSTTEAEDPSAQDMANLINKIKKSGVRVVFAENINNAKVISAVASEAKVKVAPALYTDALGGKGSPAETYLQMIRYNVQTIVSLI